MGTIRVLWTAALLALVACHTASASPAAPRSLIESESDSTAWLGERDCPTQCDSSCSCITKKSACEAACQQCLYDGVPCGTKIQAPLKGRIITPVHLVNAAPSTKTRFQQKAVPVSSRSAASESSRNRTESSESSRLSPQSLFKPVPIRNESSRKSESSRRAESTRQAESSRRSESSRIHESSRHESTKRSESSRSESSKRESSESSRRKVHIPLQQDNKLAPLSRPDATAAKDKQSKLNQIVELQSKIIAMLQSQSSKQKQQLESQNQLIEQQKQQSHSLSSLLKRSESSRSESGRSESSRSESADVAKRAALVKRLQEIVGLNNVVHPFFTSDASGIQILPLTVPVAIPKGTSLASLLGGSSSVTADVTSSLSKPSSSSAASSASASSSSAATKAAHEARLNRIVQVLEQLVGWVRTRRGQVGEDFGSEQHIAEVLEQASSLTQRN